MAETVIDLKIAWENNQHFHVQSQEDSGPVLTVVKVDENGDIAALWPSLIDLMERHIKGIMARVGTEMAKP